MDHLVSCYLSFPCTLPSLPDATPLLRYASSSFKDSLLFFPAWPLRLYLALFRLFLASFYPWRLFTSLYLTHFPSLSPTFSSSPNPNLILSFLTLLHRQLSLSLPSKKSLPPLPESLPPIPDTYPFLQDLLPSLIPGAPKFLAKQFKLAGVTSQVMKVLERMTKKHILKPVAIVTKANMDLYQAKLHRGSYEFTTKTYMKLYCKE